MRKTMLSSGGLLVALALIIVTVGCSGDSPVNPMGSANADVALSSTLTLKESTSDNRLEFKYAGKVATVDYDNRVVAFADSDVKVEVARDAEVRLYPSRELIQFSEKTIAAGDWVSVTGYIDREGIRVGTYLEIREIDDVGSINVGKS